MNFLKQAGQILVRASPFSNSLNRRIPKLQRPSRLRVTASTHRLIQNSSKLNRVRNRALPFTHLLSHLQLLHKQRSIHKLVRRHRPRQHRHTGNHRFYHRVPPAVTHKRPNRHVSQYNNLRGPPPYNQTPPSRPILKPRQKINAPIVPSFFHRPHEVDPTFLQSRTNRNRLFLREHDVASKTQIHHLALVSLIEPRNDVVYRNRTRSASLRHKRLVVYRK
ncbi:hypothetical protein PIB30_002161 [Stylosanthes scabra]|uniref:Uncharacterized protein n=1 Tax=Stylosanthes scabra TaxID=79078 RepID=A0ABU6S2B9_9FABA|nr:hypothetical protein [Stylosanthes scabra]